MLKSNRLGGIEIPSLQNYSIAVRGAATPVLALLGGRSPQIRVRCWHVPVTQSSAFEHPVVLTVGTAAGGERRLNGYIFFRRGFAHSTSKRPLVSNDFQAYSKTNNRAPDGLSPPRDNEWRRSDIISAHHLRHDRAAPKTRDALKAL
jgi:hypothetical protein